MYKHTVEELSQQFQEDSISFLTESDIQAELYQKLNNQVDYEAEIKRQPKIPDSYKRSYYKDMTDQDRISKTHTELTIQKDEEGHLPRLDVAVLKDKIKTVHIDKGSKKFEEKDLDAVFELKFIKNRYYFRKEGKKSDLKNLNDKALEERLNFGYQSIGEDIDELNNLEVENKFMLIFSNFNFLFHNPSEPEKDKELWNRIGRIAKKQIKQKSNNSVDILYVYPSDSVWL